MKYEAPEILLMVDVENLDVGPKGIVTQLGFLFAPADDPETILYSNTLHLPIQPQMVLNRTISADTLIWWLTDPSVTQAARDEFKLSSGNDYEELPALLRSLTRKYEQIVDGRVCEVWSRGPMDWTQVESLMGDCAVETPWHYAAFRDLRTHMSNGQIGTDDVPRDNERFPQHVALADCKYQMLCYVATLQAMAKSK